MSARRERKREREREKERERETERERSCVRKPQRDVLSEIEMKKTWSNTKNKEREEESVRE